MTPLRKILAAYCDTSRTEREKGTCFKELIRTYATLREPEAMSLEIMNIENGLPGYEWGATTLLSWMRMDS